MMHGPLRPDILCLGVDQSRQTRHIGGPEQSMASDQVWRADQNKIASDDILADHPLPTSIAIANRRIHAFVEGVALREMAGKA